MSTSRRLVLAIAALLLAGGCHGSCGRPNVILISIDTLRADRLNSYGFADRRVSPHIDALADDGILFENCITASPWTTPAHMSLLTSLNPGAHGVTDSFLDLRQALRAKQQFTTLSGSVVTLAEALAADEFHTAAFTAGGTVDPRIGFGQGFESYDTSMLKLGDHNTSAIIDWLRNNKDERFFLFLHTFEVHSPYIRTDFLDAVLPADRAAALKQAIRTVGRSISTQDPVGRAVGTAQAGLISALRRHHAYDAEVCEALYLGGIHRADRWIGSLVAELKRLGIYGRTMLILTSDHGEEFADHDPMLFYDRHGHSLYEEVLRVPLIIKLPRQRHAGRRERRLVRLIDVMPTILDLAEATRPPSNMQGVSLRPLWQGRAADAPGFAISEALATRAEKKSIRTDRYKLVLSINEATVRDYGRGLIPAELAMRELFDLETDPRERMNLLADPILPSNLELAADLEVRLRDAVTGHRARAGEITLDSDTLDRLKGLGYVEE